MNMPISLGKPGAGTVAETAAAISAPWADRGDAIRRHDEQDIQDVHGVHDTHATHVVTSISIATITNTNIITSTTAGACIGVGIGACVGVGACTGDGNRLAGRRHPACCADVAGITSVMK